MSIFSNWLKREPEENRTPGPTSIRQAYPFFIKAPLVLIGVYLFFLMLSLLQDVIVPFAFAGLIAILLNPLYNRFLKWRINKVLSLVLTILTAILVVLGVLLFLSSQIVQFGDMLPQLKEKSLALLHQAQSWLSLRFGISTEKQMSMINEAISSSRAYVGRTLDTVFGIISVFVLIPLYIFLLLFYKPLILNFIFEVFQEDHSGKVAEILRETKSAIQSYVIGLMVEMVIVAVLNSIALLILGVPYAILLGVIGAILNVIPYIGGVIAILLPVLISLVSKDGFTTPLLIVAAYALIQFIDNNIIVPRVVSSKVSVNALVSIVIVLLGGMLWGVSGMFLSIPFVGVLKIIFDRVDELKPWGKLLGEEMPKQAPPQVVNREDVEN